MGRQQNITFDEMLGRLPDHRPLRRLYMRPFGHDVPSLMARYRAAVRLASKHAPHRAGSVGAVTLSAKWNGTGIRVMPIDPNSDQKKEGP
jgi:hypothetical protein